MGEMSIESQDGELLWRYVRDASEASFRELVTRHIDLVYGAAFRQLHDRNSAQDVTQNVFVLLARRAPFLTGHPSLAGWLYHAATNQARQQFRTEQRRIVREKTADYLVSAMRPNPSDPLVPVLDEVLQELRAADREILMLRYMEENSLRELGARLGLQEDAARKRVAKALDALTKRFELRGYKVAGAAAAATALRVAGHTAPAGLAGGVATAALTAGPGSAIGLTLLLAKFLMLRKIEIGLVCLALGTAPLVWQANSIIHSKREQRILRNRLEQLQGVLLTDQQEQAQLQRQLQAAESSVQRLREQLQRGKLLAKSLPDGKDALVYRWSDASDYVRLPKALFQRINLPDPEIGQFGIISRGKVSPLFLQTIGLGTSQAAEVARAVAETTAAFKELETNHSFLTNQLPNGEKSGEFPALVIEPYRAEAELQRKNLKNRLASTLDADQVEAFWSHLNGAFAEGDQERICVLRRLQDKDMSFIEEYNEGHMTHGVAIEDLPEPLKPFAQAWKSNPKTTNPVIGHE